MAKKPVAQTLSAAISVVCGFPVETFSGNVQRVEGGFQVDYKLPRSSKIYTLIIPTSQRISVMIGEDGYIIRRALSSEVDSTVLKDVVVYEECTVGVMVAKDGSEFEVEVANACASLTPFEAEEEEVAPKKAATKKKAAPVVEEDDEEEEEEEEVAPAPKKKAVAKPATKKKAAPVVEDDEEEEEEEFDDEEEEEEEVAPKKKAAAKAPAAKGKKKPAVADDEEDEDEDFDF